MKQHRFYFCISVFFYHGATAPVGQDLLIIEDSWSYSDIPHSVGLLWKRDQTDAETCTRQHTKESQETNIHVPGGIQTHNPSKRAAADPRLRLRGHWDRRISSFNIVKIKRRCTVASSLLAPKLYDVWNIRMMTTLHLYKTDLISSAKTLVHW